MSRERRKLTQKDKEEIGLQCCNCHSIKNLEYHHIIPFALGGSDINSNMCCLCRDCHIALHHSDSSYFKKVKLIRPDKKTGRPKTTIDKLPPLFINDIKEGKLNPTELSRKYQIARNTVYKWKRIIEDGE